MCCIKLHNAAEGGAHGEQGGFFQPGKREEGAVNSREGYLKKGRLP